MISQPPPNFKTQFSQDEEVGSYDNIALNQRIVNFFEQTLNWKCHYFKPCLRSSIVLSAKMLYRFYIFRISNCVSQVVCLHHFCEVYCDSFKCISH